MSIESNLLEETKARIVVLELLHGAFEISEWGRGTFVPNPEICLHTELNSESASRVDKIMVERGFVSAVASVDGVPQFVYCQPEDFMQFTACEAPIDEPIRVLVAAHDALSRTG